MSLAADARRVLTGWAPTDPVTEALRRDHLGFLAAHPDGVWRTCMPGHITASALVLDANGRRALLTLHRKGGFWAQLGGHCEAADATLADAALREAGEESGIDDLTLLPGPIDLDRHELSAAFGACRAHLDVRYVAVAPPGAGERPSRESTALRWFPLEKLLATGTTVRALGYADDLGLPGRVDQPDQADRVDRVGRCGAGRSGAGRSGGDGRADREVATDLRRLAAAARAAFLHARRSPAGTPM